MAVTDATVNTLVQLDVPKTFGNLATAINLQLNFGGSTKFTSGSGANQYANVYGGTRSVTSGTPDTIDVTGGSLTQPDGSSFVVTDIILIAIKNNGTAGQTLTLGGGTNAVSSILGATGTVTIPPGATFLIVNPAASAYAVNGSTAHILQVTCASGTATYDVVVMGH